MRTLPRDAKPLLPGQCPLCGMFAISAPTDAELREMMVEWARLPMQAAWRAMKAAEQLVGRRRGLEAVEKSKCAEKMRGSNQ